MMFGLFKRISERIENMAPIVRYFRFLQNDYNMELKLYNPGSKPWSRWANDKYEITIDIDYSDKRPVIINIDSICESENDGETLIDERLVSPVIKGNDTRGSKDLFTKIESWAKVAIRDCFEKHGVSGF